MVYSNVSVKENQNEKERIMRGTGAAAKASFRIWIIFAVLAMAVRAAKIFFDYITKTFAGK